MPTDDRARGSGDPARATGSARRDVERWFIRRGVPQLIEGYSTEPSMDARAAPFIAIWLVVGSVLLWGIRPGWSAAGNVVAVLGTIAFIAAGYALVAWLRGRVPWHRPPRFDLWDIGLFGILPAIPTALMSGSPASGILALGNALLGIGAIYVVTGFGLAEMAAWTLSRLREQLVGIVGLVGRTLPLLLILVFFLMFAEELWEAAHELDGGELAAVLALLLAIASALVVTAGRAEIRKLEARTDVDAIQAEARSTPAAPLVDAPRMPLTDVPRLGWLQRLNLVSLVLVNQLLQSVLVATLVMACLVAFGLLALPAVVQERWVGESVVIVANFDLLGDSRTLSGELIAVTALLSGIVGLYFTGLALTDPVHRAEHFARGMAEIRLLLAARSVYLAAGSGAVDASVIRGGESEAVGEHVAEL